MAILVHGLGGFGILVAGLGFEIGEGTREILRANSYIKTAGALTSAATLSGTLASAATLSGTLTSAAKLSGTLTSNTKPTGTLSSPIDLEVIS